MSRERELLERAIEEWDSDRDLYEFHKVMEEIRAYLSTPEPTQDEEPFGYVEFIEDAGLNFCTLEPAGDYPYQPIYLHPAPRPEFVRLSEEQIMKIVRADPDFDEMMWDKTAVRFARAIENALEEKNK